MNTTEVIAFVLGIVNVTLVVRRSIWNYPFGIAMVSLYAVVFAEARLYSDMLLQFFFIAVNAYGWISWIRHRAATGAVVVEGMTRSERWRWTLATTAIALVWGGLMHRFTDASLPWWDAAVAAASIAAQWLLARRKWENWVLWIAVDIGSIGLYLVKELWLTALLYLLFLLLAAWGLVDWRRRVAA